MPLAPAPLGGTIGIWHLAHCQPAPALIKQESEITMSSSCNNYQNGLADRHRFTNPELYTLATQIKCHPALSLVNRGALYDYWFFHFERDHMKTAKQFLTVLDSLLIPEHAQ